SEVIFDGEIVAYSQSEGRCLPFSALQKRLGRKTVSEDLQAEVPVACMVFDLLYLDGVVLLDEPLSRRKQLLEGLDLPYPLVKAPSQAVPLEDFAPVADDGRWTMDDGVQPSADDGRWTMDDGIQSSAVLTPSSIVHRPSS